MNLVYTIDNNFVPQLAANIQSVKQNNPNTHLNFYILSMGLSKANIDNLTAFFSDELCDVIIIDISDFKDRIAFEFDTTGWNEIVLARLLLDNYLPNKIERVIYLDADTICRSSLRGLWQADLDGKTIAMAPEPTADRNRRTSLGIGSYPYCNAGVVLFNLKKWRDNDMEKGILNFCKQNKEKLFANDQDALNVYLKDDIKVMSISYNYSNIFDYYPFEYLNKLMPNFCSKIAYEHARANPAIVHFLGEDRPWRAGNTHRFSSDYFYYLRQTPWSEAPIEYGWEQYYKAWGLFNTITSPFPSARYKVITSLIPLFMKVRAKKRRQDESR